MPQPALLPSTALGDYALERIGEAMRRYEFANALVALRESAGAAGYRIENTEDMA